MNDMFTRMASVSAKACGKPLTFLLSCLSVIVWAATGPIFNYSDTWQLVINTGTTVITFLVVFLIQNTQNRDMAAIHLKLDELVLVTKDARNDILEAETKSEEKILGLKR